MKEPVHLNMQIKAVVFDYGGVLCFHPPEEEVQALADLCGLSRDEFLRIYWGLRVPYDRGDLDGPAYWDAFAKSAGQNYSTAQVKEFIRRDVGFWLHLDARMIDWAAKVRASGLQTAMLSNMPCDLGEHLRAHTDLLQQFDHVTFSYEAHSVKPDASIYRHCLEGLQADAAETLFLDDRPANVEGAEAVGMKALVFESPEKLAMTLSKNGLRGIVQFSRDEN